MVEAPFVAHLPRVNFTFLVTLGKSYLWPKDTWEKEELQTNSHQEKLFKKNPWEFSKSAVRGELETESVAPEFAKQKADAHYTKTYSTPIVTDFTKLNWLSFINVTPENPEFKTFNMDPFRPRDVREATSKVTKNKFHTNSFTFKKGVTQGDPMSPIIFILAFQPIIDHLMIKKRFD